MSANRYLCFLLILIMQGVMSACSSIPTVTPVETRATGPLQRDYYDVNIPSHDGTLLRATVFQPALAPGETAPLILHAHGFGVFRMSAPISIYGMAIYSGIAAKSAWNKNYWVISFDQRGHGQSDGMIRVMDPDYEVKDVTAIIDWATANISRISPDKKGDQSIGMIGESYGGGAQLLSVVTDKRIDTIVPITTWNSFQTALTPGQVPKSGWLTTLITVGNSLNPGHMEPVLNRAYWQARNGRVEKEIFDFLATHSPRYNCLNGALPSADILFIQGMRDVLFPLNEAKENFECMSNGENDVRLIATQGGHLLPFTQWSWVPGYDVENTIHCDEQTLDLPTLAVDWFDEKLRGNKGKADYIPHICLTHDYESGSTFKTIPIANEVYPFGKITLANNFTGFFETPLGFLDSVSGFMMPRLKSPALLDHTHANTSIRPAFVPLKVMKKEGILAGIPKIQVQLTPLDPEDEPILFVGIGVKRASNRKIELISDQITPLRGEGEHSSELAGISTRLNKNDIVGIWVSGYNNQYRFSGGDWFAGSELSGNVILPTMESPTPSSIASHP